MDICGDELARRYRRGRTRLPPPNRFPTVRLPGDARYSLLKNGALRGAHDVVVEPRDRVAPANCAL